MIDTWNPAKLNEKISGRDSWNTAILNEAVTDRDSWNPAVLNESAGETPIKFEATITASFPEGATCTATDGTTTLTADDNPMAFSIPNEGTWALSCSANGLTLTGSVVITTNGQTETVDLTPVGETVIPTDSVPMLIACAGIGDSEITTIAGALADLETLTAILESTNAVDYLVRSTTFASDVTADSVAMTGIGANNYASNTLLADSTWLEAICNSTYFESVLNVKVPTMTSNTTPSGLARCGDEDPTQKSYKAFDGDTVTAAQTANPGQNKWIEYVFENAVKVYKVSFLIDYMTAPSSITIKVSHSSDGTNYTDDTSQITVSNKVAKTIDIQPDNAYRYWRIDVILSEDKVIIANEIQFYGRVDV